MNKRLLHVAKFATAMTSNLNCTPSPSHILCKVHFVNYVEYIYYPAVLFVLIYVHSCIDGGLNDDSFVLFK